MGTHVEKSNDALQSFVNRLGENSSKRSGLEYNLGMLIADLEKANGDLTVLIKVDDLILNPTYFMSWRGNYCELSLGFHQELKSPMKASFLLGLAKSEVDIVEEGYKGGSFLMDESTPIHIANYGDIGLHVRENYQCYKVIGTAIEDSKLFIMTRLDE